jgi:hypothetical protein
MTHVLYDPVKLDFVRDSAGKPVTTEKAGPTRADAPAGKQWGTHWMQVTDEDDSTVFQPNSPVVKRGEPEIILRGAHAIRLYPLVRKS